MTSGLGKERSGLWSAVHWTRQHAAECYVATLFAFYLVTILMSQVAPSLTDFSDWTYEGVLFRDHLLGRVDTAHVFKHYPVPNSAATVGIGLLSLVFSWQVAAKLWLVLLLMLGFGVAHLILKRRAGVSALWLIAPAGMFLSVNLWYGFVNFQLGLCLTVLIAWLLLRHAGQRFLVGVLLTLAFFSHMIPFIFSSLIVSFYALQHRRLRLLYQLVPGAILSLWYVCGRMLVGHNADGSAGMVGAVRNYSAAFWAYKVNSYLKSMGFVNPGTEFGSVSMGMVGTKLFLLLFSLNLLLCAIVGWFLVKAGFEAYRAKKPERFVWGAGLVFTSLYVVAPATMLGISDPGSRLLQAALAVLLFLLPVSAGSVRKALRCAAGCAFVLQLAALFLFTRVVLSHAQPALTVHGIPRRLVIFAHVPNHAEDYFYEALERGDMRLRVFPTAMFLNTPAAEATPLAP